MKTKLAITVAVVGILGLLTAGIALTQGKGYGFGQGYGPGYGMMQGYGPGYGMMQGYGGYGPGMMAGYGLHMGIYSFVNDPGFAKEVGLTSTQVDKLKKIQTTSQKSLAKTGSELQVLRVELNDLLGQTSPDIKAVDSKLDEIGKKENAVRKQLVHQQIEARAILTEEQLEKMESYFGGRRAGWGSKASKGNWIGCPYYNENYTGGNRNWGHRRGGGGGMMDYYWDDNEK